MTNREIYFKIEKLDDNENVIEVKSPLLKSGKITVSSTDVHRRKCRFTLAEPLPSDWVTYRWRLYYGVKEGDTIRYYSQGIFMPRDPKEVETPEGKLTTYQGVDKTELLIWNYDVTHSFAENDTLKEVAKVHYDGIGETKQNLDDLPYDLNTNYTFGEWRSAWHTLTTLVGSFTAETYYDRNGWAVLRDLPPVSSRPVAFEFPEGSDAIHASIVKTEKNSDYWNRVIVTGGKNDEPIVRKELTDTAEVTRVGRTITKFYRYSEADTQAQVDALAEARLYDGTKIPVELEIQTVPLLDLEVNQIIKIGFDKYEVTSFDIPLDLSLQTIKASKIT